MKLLARFAGALVFLVTLSAAAQPATDGLNPRYEPDMARSVGADDLGMKGYVLVILKTGPNRMPAGPERDEMFKGHFANINRLTAEGKLVLAGPLDGVDGWRGLFILAAADIAEAKSLMATDPVVAKGEMVPELHKFYGSAALVLLRDLHDRIAKKRM